MLSSVFRGLTDFKRNNHVVNNSKEVCVFECYTIAQNKKLIAYLACLPSLPFFSLSSFSNEEIEKERFEEVERKDFLVFW